MFNDTAKKEDSTKFEIEFYERLLKDQPDFIEALKALAELYTKSGRHNEGLVLDKRLAKLLPTDAIVYYNLACSYSLLKDIDKSLEAIKKALDLGYSDFSYMRSDPDLDNLRKDKRSAEIFSKELK
jgi:tetratricopeptide (TPR) repeat protein